MPNRYDVPIDLNLLVIFDAVMAELNVTRAAAALSTTQPAVSKALRRLRHILNDDLFIKVPTGVKPTPKAEQLWLSIREGLHQIRQATQPASFNPGTSTATLTLALNDYVASLLVPRLVPYLQQHAPQINLRIMPSMNINAPMLLEHSEIDLAIGSLPKARTRLQTQTLFTEHYLCAMRRGHPLAKKKLTLEQFAQANHLLITLTGEAIGFVDRLLAEKGLQRRIAVTVNQFALAPEVIVNSDSIAALCTRTIHNSGLADQLHLVPLPFEMEPVHIRMMWHERSNRDPVNTWLRSLLIQICESL